MAGSGTKIPPSTTTRMYIALSGTTVFLKNPIFLFYSSVFTLGHHFLLPLFPMFPSFCMQIDVDSPLEKGETTIV